MIHKRHLPARILCAYVMVLAAGFGLPNCTVAQVETASGADAAPESTPPVDFRTSRVEIRNEYQDLQGWSPIDYLVPRFDFSVGPDLSFRVETPIVFRIPTSRVTMVNPASGTCCFGVVIASRTARGTRSSPAEIGRAHV